MGQQQDTATFIAKKALSLFVDHGYQGTSVREIADACGMNVATLYLHFKAKSDILARLALQDTAYLKTTLEGSPRDADPLTSLRVAMEEWYRHCDRTQDAIVVAYREISHMPTHIRSQWTLNDERLRAAFEALLTKAVQAGQADVEDIPIVAVNIVLTGHLWALRRWHLRKKYTLERYTQSEIDLTQKSILPAKAVNDKMDFVAKKALGLFLRRGYQGTSVREIAKACSMNIGTLYYHMSSKANVLSYLASQDISYVEEFLAGPPSNGDTSAPIKDAIASWYSHCDATQDAIIFAYQQALHFPAELLKRLLQADTSVRAGFEALLDDAKRSGHADVEDPAIVATNIEFLGHIWALRRWHFREKYTFQQYVKLQTNLIEKAIRPGIQ